MACNSASTLAALSTTVAAPAQRTTWALAMLFHQAETSTTCRLVCPFIPWRWNPLSPVGTLSTSEPAASYPEIWSDFEGAKVKTSLPDVPARVDEPDGAGV